MRPVEVAIAVDTMGRTGRAEGATMSIDDAVAGEPVHPIIGSSRWSVADTPFSVSTSTVDDGVRVAASGEVDISTADRLRIGLAEAMDGASSISIDLTEVTFMDSHGLRVLIEACVAAADRRFVIESASPNVRRLIHVSGLGESFGMAPRS